MQPIILSLGISILSFVLTYNIIPIFMELNHSKKLFGVDINKCEDIKNLADPDRREVPEALGIVPATVFLVVSIISQTIINLTFERKLEFNAGLLSICFMIFLGFADDVLDLKWRYKLVLPTIASIPMILAYSGSTSIIIPNFISRVIGIKELELGILFLIYMSLLAVFCTNSINIYAGINGLEVGQSLIIGFSVLTFNLLEIFKGNEQGFFPLVIIMPFCFTSLALFWYNHYPAKCFIGDTYCYFAGMTFACTGILGHFSKTLLLFFIPQILNFLISLPQVIFFKFSLLALYTVPGIDYLSIMPKPNS
jgi:UDP-N-acetylglucosamine--dolichyl-phosphate N-acetylglucosaminephosphotransferase